jgi:hypothetical protein
MAWNKYLFIIFMLTTSFTAFAQFTTGQKYFISKCETPYSFNRAEFAWLKHLFKTDSCTKVAEELLKVKSYNEFLPPMSKEYPILPAPWTDAYPEIYGLKSSQDIKDVVKALPDHKIDYKNLFKDPTDYEAFKNISIIDFTVRDFPLGICTILKRLKNIKTAIVDYSSLEKIGECNDLEDMPELIITGDFIGTTDKKLWPFIVGIETYTGRIRELQRYYKLRYVGVWDDKIDVRGLITVQSLTHLSINTTESIENVEELSEMHNLSYLGLTCVKSAIYGNRRNPLLKMERCEKPFLREIDFIQNLEWLEHINFSFNGLTDVKVLEKMTQLKAINISHNQIHALPDVGQHKDLTYFNYDHNPVGNQ